MAMEIKKNPFRKKPECTIFEGAYE